MAKKDAKIWLWVVEMFNDYTKRWEPTVGTGTTRETARGELVEWEERNPADDFRIRKYIPEVK